MSRAVDRTLRSWVNREGSAPRMWQRLTDEDENLGDEAVAQWNGRPREKRRLSTVKRYIRELAVRCGRSLRSDATTTNSANLAIPNARARTGSSTSSTATTWRSESPAAPTSADHHRARSPTTGAGPNPSSPRPPNPAQRLMQFHQLAAAETPRSRKPRRARFAPKIGIHLHVASHDKTTGIQEHHNRPRSRLP